MPRKRSSVADDLIEITMKLPWWVGLTLAVASYFILHSIAVSNEPGSIKTQDIAGAATRQLSYTLSYLGQFILPMIFLIGASLSAYHAGRKSRLLEQQSGLDSIHKLSWQEFEELVGEYYRRNGYSVKQTHDGPDGGIDLILQKEGVTTVVQCKQWRNSKIGVSVVRELFGVMTAMGADKAIVVSVGKFTPDAEAFAYANHIDLVTGHHLVSLIGSVQKDKQYTPDKGKSPRMVFCPRCKSKMVLRTAQKGAHSGEQFWGCSRYPRCKGIRPYAS